MDCNKILNSVGGFGLFQAFIYVLAAIVQLFAGIHMLANVFLMGEPDHRCFVPRCDNNSSQYSEPFIHFVIPNITDEDGVTTLNQCEEYESINGKNYCGKDAFNSNKTTLCTSYKYDHSVFEETVVSQFDIVCQRSNYGAMSQSIFMVGFLFGSMGFGMIADKYGRKTVMMLASIVLLTSSIATTFSTNLQIFSLFRFITAAGVSGVIQASFIIAVEYIGTSNRILYCNTLQMLFSIGELILVSIAYFVRDWRKLELMLSIPGCILLAYYWLLPESFRWLVSKGKYSEAKETVLKIARWNRITLPESLLEVTEYTKIQTEAQVKPSSGPLSLIRTPQMRKWTLNLFFNWIVNAMVYYGLSLGASNLSSNVYVNFALLAAVEIPAVLLATVALLYCGRKHVLCAVMVFGGVACGSTIFIPFSLQWLSTTMAVLGKSAIAASFTLLYVYSPEIYPTTVRSTGFGMSSMFARFGGIIAPFINELRNVYQPLPMIIFGISSIAAGLLALALPETHNRQLPETVEEAEKLAIEPLLIQNDAA